MIPMVSASPAAKVAPSPAPKAALSPVPAPSRFKRGLVLLGVMALGVLVAYAAGRLQTQKQIDVLQAQVSEASERRDSVQNDVNRLDARRRLHLALIALDE